MVDDMNDADEFNEIASTLPPIPLTTIESRALDNVIRQMAPDVQQQLIDLLNSRVRLFIQTSSGLERVGSTNLRIRGSANTMQ